MKRPIDLTGRRFGKLVVIAREGSRDSKPLWLCLCDCGNPRCRVYRYYGAKGVTVSAEWRTYQGFSAWARSCGYVEGLTIERRDSNGNYEPTNCEWITKEENSRRSWNTLPRRPDGRVMARVN